jgi:hypothetical protein
MGTVHPILGALLLSLVFLVLWTFAPSERAAQTTPRRRSLFSVRATLTPLSWRYAGMLVLLTAVFAAASVRLGAFEPLPPLGPPGGTVAAPLDYVRLPEGWTIVGKGDYGLQNLFGRDSHSYYLYLQSAEGARVTAQLITTPSRARLTAYGPEACRVYHGSDVVGQRTVELGAGGVATMIDAKAGRQEGVRGRMSVIYWEAPFSLQGREEHARVVLFAYERDEGSFPQSVTPGIAPGGGAYDRAGSTLVDLARGIAREVVAAAGPNTQVARPA